MGAFDGWFRTLLFIVALCYAVMAGTLFSWILVGVSAILFGSAVMMWCPIYAMFGISTLPKGAGH